ncbi:hypothetical protein [Polyangium spumosum]|uniref:Lipoprotein n=1 Tax=Polyangium spumosum TaxID=889282 RepID=A0A6N7PG25_9BACT|nr:hypothetical protein [Polyangium spumosum]MRG90767.1 hypothetical protein [Polyangium spumosum]
MAVRRSATRGLFVVLAWVAGCQLVSGLPDELSLGTGGGGGGVEPAVCVRDEVPAAPAVQGAGGEEEFVVALRTISLEDNPDGALPGMNLDGLCSCAEDGPACRSLDSDSGGGTCDDGAGRDAGSNIVFGALGYLLQVADTSSSFSALAESGGWTLLLRVRGYSGTAEDDEVEVSWYESPGRAAPAWQGSDAWPVASDAVTPGQSDPYAAKYRDPVAYVTGGKLVALLPAASLRFAGGDMSMRLQLVDARLVARIEAIPGGRYRLREGKIGARIPVPEVFAALSSLRTMSGAPLCTDAPLYPATKNLTCRAVDLLLGEPDEDTPCEALSFGANFHTEPAALGPVLPLPEAPAGCASEVDPISDTCAEL